MIASLQSELLTRLDTMKTTNGIKTVDAWTGELAILLKQPKLLPGIFVAYKTGEYGQNQTGTVVTTMTARRLFQVILIVHSFGPSGRRAGSIECYGLLDAIVALLANFPVGNNDVVWPVKDEMLTTENGVLAYALTVEIKELIRK